MNPAGVGIDWARSIRPPPAACGASPPPTWAAGQLPERRGPGTVRRGWKALGGSTKIGRSPGDGHPVGRQHPLDAAHPGSNHRKARIVVARTGLRDPVADHGDHRSVTPTVIKTFEYKDVGITLDITPHVSQAA